MLGSSEQEDHLKPNQPTAEQIVKILEQAEKGEQPIAAVCREHGIAENTFYRWRKAYGGMAVNEAQRLKELEKENARLKRLLAERMLELDLLKEVLQKKANHDRSTRNGAVLSGWWFVSATGLCVGPDAARDLSICGAPIR